MLIEGKRVRNQLPMKWWPTSPSTCRKWPPMDTQSILFLIPSRNFMLTSCLEKPIILNTTALTVEKSSKPSTLSKSTWECLNTPVTDHLPVQLVGKVFDCPARCVDTRSSTPTSDPLNARFVEEHSIDTLRWQHITKHTRIWWRMKARLLCNVMTQHFGMEPLIWINECGSIVHFTVNFTHLHQLRCNPTCVQGNLKQEVSAKWPGMGHVRYINILYKPYSNNYYSQGSHHEFMMNFKCINQRYS